MKVRLTKLAGTTPNSMRQYIDGRRHIQADLAIRFEKATVALDLNPISRMDLCKACRNCEYARLAAGWQKENPQNKHHGTIVDPVVAGVRLPTPSLLFLPSRTKGKKRENPTDE